MAFSTRFRFRNLPRFLTGALGDMWYRATNGDLTAVRGTKATGKAPVIQADGGLTWETPAGTSSYTDEQAQDAVGAMIADTATINLTYTDATPELKGDVIPSGIKLDDLGTPDDNTDLDATATVHGLLKKLGTNGQIVVSDGTNQQWKTGHFSVNADLTATSSVGSLAIVTVPIAGTIIQSDIDADVSGSAVVNVYKAAAGTPTTFTSIVASAKPTLSAAQSATDSTLTGWTTSVSAGDRLKFVCESLSTAVLVCVSLRLRRA